MVYIMGKILLLLITFFAKQNKDVFLLSFALICISFFGTIITLYFTGDNIHSNFESPVYLGKSEDIEDIQWFDIFKHNLIVLSPVIIGAFTFGFISFWYIMFQSYLLGLTIYGICQQLPLLIVLKYTLPHGIFELLAMCFAGTFAFKPGVVTIKCILSNKSFINKYDLRDMLVTLFLFVFFLLISSLVEGLITVRL